MNTRNIIPKPVIVGVVGIAAVGVILVSSPDDDSSSSDSTGQQRDGKPPAMHEGTYWPIDESAAGTWQTTGSARTNGRPCSWNHFSDPPGDIEHSFGPLDWADYQIARGDVAVGDSSRCGRW